MSFEEYLRERLEEERWSLSDFLSALALEDDHAHEFLVSVHYDYELSEANISRTDVL
jgi:hypothetical protein